VRIMDLSHRSLPQGLGQLFLENYQLVFRTAYGVTGRREDAEDVVQSLFLRLLQRGFPPDVRRNARGYLYRATMNLALDRVRTSRRQALREHLVGIQSVASAAMDCAANEEMEALLLNVTAELSPRLAELLRLRYADNRSDADIARMLGTSRGAIAVSLCRARAKVRKLMVTHNQGLLLARV
jgi:RNA polymerase sigma-70 factor (ECF subfamily)